MSANIILPTQDNDIPVILTLLTCNLAGGPLRTKLGKKTWLYQTVIQNSRCTFMDVKIRCCRFKVIWLLHSFEFTSMILSQFKITRI